MGTRNLHRAAHHVLLWLGVVVTVSCSSRNRTFRIPTIDNNVCKRLSGEAVYYAVFVDSKSTGPWSAHDIRSTLDSIRVAMDWIEGQAAARGFRLKVEVVAHQQDGIMPVKVDLSKKSLEKTLLGPNGERAMDNWAEKAARQVAATIPPDTSTITRTKNNPTNTERLIARIRDVHAVDNVALFFMVNNYYKEDLSVVLHAGQNDKVEYGVQSYKRPSVIAHEFLHLFGALDLYVTPFDKKRAMRKRKEFAMQEFPKEIMAFAERDLDSLEIGPLTEYLVGWKPELDPRYIRMITGKKIRVVKY
ncbi:MAG: hypothetical protein IPJ76_06255 [Flavobacteriales bacterium]|nr:MAG: hypothetical protein IPJ76_06255 [Flavobacteriales bacterium]